MNDTKIKEPKIFISYAWGTKDYQAKVLAFASDLMNDGIDVQLDKWNLKEGNDTYAFMEQCVTDPDITNVLILLDEQYASKADKRSGGVGTETQIISAEVYNKVSQDKFIPIIFERDEDGNVCRPVYLKSLLYFDLSDEDKYDDEYKRLVRRLYGVETYKKPELGARPSWVDSESTVTTKTKTSFNIFKSNQPIQSKGEKFSSHLFRIKEEIINFKPTATISDSEYIAIYSETKSIRDELLELLKYLPYVERGERLVAEMYEDIHNQIHMGHDILDQIKQTLLHEIFIYTIAIYYKNKNYSALSYTLNKTYFENYGSNTTEDSFSIFRYNNSTLDYAISVRDNTNYYSGTAQLWMENINIDICSKNDFIFADLLCYNCSIFNKWCINEYYWFPITYVYGENNNTAFRSFATKLKSVEHLHDIINIFGYENVEDFKEKYSELETKYNQRNFNGYRYSGCYKEAPCLLHCIKLADMGTLH